MNTSKTKNIKISERHHDKLKNHCEKHGFKIYRIIEKWIDSNCSERKNSLYDE